jgi:hypothetical protein
MKVIATSFADLGDLAAFKKCKATGKSDEACFKVGDNGIGFTGLVCATEATNYCALPSDVWKAKWGTKAKASGKGVAVTIKGKRVEGKLGDTLPATENINNGAGIDLNPGFAKAFGLKPPFKIKDVEWEWL